MKIRGIFAAAAVTLASVVSVFAQNDVTEMMKIIPPDAVVAAYGNGKKITSGMFMHGLLNMMKNNPAMKEKAAEIEAGLQKNSEGECLLGVSVNVKQEKQSAVETTVCGLVKSGDLAARWDSNIRDLNKEDKFTVQQGNFNGMDYVSVYMDEPVKTTGYALKLDKTTAYFTILCSDDNAKEPMKPALPVFHKKTAAFVQKLDTSSCLSVAVDADAIKKIIEKNSQDGAAVIPPELAGTHVVVISISERGPILRLTMRMYADETTLADAQKKVKEMLDEAKKAQPRFAILLNGTKVSKKADQLSVSLEMPSQLLLGLVEMSLLLEQAEREAAETADDEEFVDPVLTEESQPAGKK